MLPAGRGQFEAAQRRFLLPGVARKWPNITTGLQRQRDNYEWGGGEKVIKWTEGLVHADDVVMEDVVTDYKPYLSAETPL